MKIKPCPFCGGTAKLVEDRIELPFSEEKNTFGVVCKTCGCNPFWFSEVCLYYKRNSEQLVNELKEKAIKAWNNRAE